jgi:two-component system response regulator HydG
VRQPLAVLAESGALAPQLARWLENGALLVPPLRQRREDVESLVLLAMDRAARVLGRDVPGIAPEALRALQEYDFPGNEAELDSIMERAVLASHGPRITLEQLPPLPVGGASAGSFLDQEREILRRAMERAGGNKTRAARALGLKRTTLIDKLRRLGLEAGGRDTEH